MGLSMTIHRWHLAVDRLTLAKQIRYKTLSWELVAVLMIAEIVSNGMLSLPSSLAVVGLVPGIILIVFLGVFGLFTAWILIQFKLRHPEGEPSPSLCFRLELRRDLDFKQRSALDVPRECC